MAEIVNSLFGLPSNLIRQQEQEAQNLFGRQLASTYEDPTERGNAQRGAMLGNAIANFGGQLFGLQSPELKRATTLEGILQEAQQESGGDQMALYPLLQEKLANAGFTREAFQVGQLAQSTQQTNQLNQAKLLTEQAQLAKAQQERQPEIVRLQNAYADALNAGDTNRASQIKAIIDKQGFIAEKVVTPENKAQQTIYNSFVKQLGEEEGALAFNEYINQQKVKVAQGGNPSIPVSIDSKGTTVGQYDEKGNFTTTKGKVIPKEEMMELRTNMDSSNALLDIISSISPQDVDLAFGKVGDFSQLPEAAKLAVNPQILDAQTKINKLGVREILTNLQSLKGASSDKEMNRIASTFPGYGADPSVMKKWMMRAATTILEFTNRKSKEFGGDAPDVNLEDIASSPLFNELTETEKAETLAKLARYDEAFKALPEKEKIKKLGMYSKSRTNIDGVKQDYRPVLKRKVVNGTTYTFDGKGWSKE
jgi:hypothetical protein